MRKQLLLLIVFCAFTGCKSTLSPEEDARSKLIGSWDWIATAGDFGGSNPSTAGYTWKNVYNNDGSYYGYRNDSLKFPGSFQILFQKSGCYNFSDAVLWLYIKGNTINQPDTIVETMPYGYIYFIGDTELVNVACGVTGVSSYYRKIK